MTKKRQQRYCTCGEEIGKWRYLCDECKAKKQQEKNTIREGERMQLSISIKKSGNELFLYVRKRIEKRLYNFTYITDFGGNYLRCNTWTFYETFGYRKGINSIKGDDLEWAIKVFSKFDSLCEYLLLIQK